MFPPEISNSVHKAKGTEALATSKLLARELVDSVRVGVYPQDTGLARSEAPRMQAGLKNVQDGPQHGTEYVRLQVSQPQWCACERWLRLLAMCHGVSCESPWT